MIVVFKQLLLNGVPDGARKIGAALSILEKDGQVIYFVGGDNYFSYPQGDRQSRRFALASLMENRHVWASELETELEIAHRTLMNWKAQYWKSGPGLFFRTIADKKPLVMTAQKSAQCAALLAQGFSAAEASRKAGIKESTLRKAIKRDAIARLAGANSASE